MVVEVAKELPVVSRQGRLLHLSSSSSLPTPSSPLIIVGLGRWLPKRRQDDGWERHCWNHHHHQHHGHRQQHHSGVGVESTSAQMLGGGNDGGGRPRRPEMDDDGVQLRHIDVIADFPGAGTCVDVSPPSPFSTLQGLPLGGSHGAQGEWRERGSPLGEEGEKRRLEAPR